MPKRLPLGISDYRELMEEDCLYVDKTLFIEVSVRGVDL